MRVVEVNSGTILIGRQGEIGVTEIRFPLGGFISTYGDGTPELLALRPGDDTAYPVPLTMSEDGTEAIWTISEVDTYIAGKGKAELRWYIGTNLAKSVTYCIIISPALDVPESETPPESEQGWVDQVVEVGAAAIAAKNAAEEAQSEAETSAEEAAASAKAAEEAGIPVFSVDEDGNLCVDCIPATAERFHITEDGYLTYTNDAGTAIIGKVVPSVYLKDASATGSTLTIQKGDGTTVTFQGGGGGGLPAVTTADDGKIMKVVNGAWALSDFYKLTENESGGYTLTL